MSFLGYLRRTPSAGLLLVQLLGILLYRGWRHHLGISERQEEQLHPVMARALVMLESFAGVMYIGLVVSRVIGLTMLRRDQT